MIAAARPTRALVLTLALLTASCATARFVPPAQKLQDAVATSTEAIGAWYAAVNELEREVWLDELVHDPSRTLDAYDAQGRPTPLLGATLSAEAVAARLDALALLGAYADNVLLLATLDVEGELAGAVDALGGGLTSLDQRFASLGADPKAGAYVQPVGAVVKLIGQTWLGAERDARLRALLDQGDPVVKRILELLEQDLAGVLVPLQTTGLAQLLATRVQRYNDARAQASLGERQAAVDDVLSLTDRWQAATAANPVATVRAMRAAHAALVALAREPDAPANRAVLAARLDAFTAAADQLAEAVAGFRRAAHQTR